MNSLLSNLGPRYSRRNSTTPIILGFILLIIVIAVLTYFLTRDDDDGKDKKDENEGENVPSIEDPTVTRTFLPDSSNSSESGTTETYEIGGGKTETYQVEYNNGISDITLSKNVKIGITWSNKSGFENVYKLVIEHYVTATAAAANADGAVASFTKTINRYESNGTEILDNKNYFKNYATELTHEFQGLEDNNTAAYSFVGTHTIKIIATYTDIDNNDVVITLSDGGVAINRPVVSETDLAATLDLTVPDVRVYQPIQGDVAMGLAVIENQEYFASTGGLDIHKSIDGKDSTRPFTLIRASTDNSNQFYFKFGDDEYLGYDSNKKLTITDTAGQNQIITLVSSSLDDTEGTRYFRLSFGSDLYALIDENGNSVVKAMADIETETVYDTLDWKLLDSAPATAPPTPEEAEAAAAAANSEKAGYGFFYEGSSDTTETHTWVVKHNIDLIGTTFAYDLLKNGAGTNKRIYVNKKAGSSNEGYFNAGDVGTVWTIVRQNCTPIAATGKCYEFGKFTSSGPVTCDEEAATICIEKLVESTASINFLMAADTTEGNACSTKFNCEPDIWFNG